MTDLLRAFLPIYLLIFFFAVFLLRTIIVWKKTGINAYVLLNQTGAYGTIGFYFKILPFFSITAVIIFSFFPEHYALLGPISWLENQILISLGLILMVASLVWIWVAQTQMGNSWRIGIDEDSKTELVTQGFFSLSRNPIFLGMKLNSLGFFLVIPNAITLVVLFLGVALIDIQVALEEEYLGKVHGDIYKEYTHSVRRWL